MQIYYYTRTGRSKAISEKLADKCDCSINEIKDSKNWDGAFGFLKGGASAMKKESIEVSYNEVNSSGNIILVFPIWAGTFPPAVKTFLAENPSREKIVLIPTSLGTKLKDRDGFRQIIDLVGKDISNLPIEIK